MVVIKSRALLSTLVLWRHGSGIHFVRHHIWQKDTYAGVPGTKARTKRYNIHCNKNYEERLNEKLRSMLVP